VNEKRGNLTQLSADKLNLTLILLNDDQIIVEISLDSFILLDTRAYVNNQFRVN
jgi:hypothetical protein